MNTLRLSPNKDVRDETRVLDRLGFTYTGLNSAGHLVFDHPDHGEIVLCCTPSARYWRNSHRRALAKLMGLSVPELEARIHGQASVGKSAPRKRRRSSRRRRAPRAVRALNAVPDPVLPEQPAPVLRAVPAIQFAPDDPISERRRDQWARMAAERDRANAECKFPWKRAA